jgi:hypothetical protein
MTRTPYYFRSSTILVAVMAAVMTAMLLAAQRPAVAGLSITDGASLNNTTPPPGGWCTLGCEPTPTTEPVDTTAPSAPVIISPTEGATLNVRSFTISGTAEANSTVRLFEGLIAGNTTSANASGQWSIELTGVSDGSHSYSAKATDAAGNVSAESTRHTVIVDATARSTTFHQ